MYKFLSLKDHVYQYIADQISDGTLLPKQKINEQQICEELSISRTPVREALIQLATEGVLENVPRKGFVIKYLKPEEARQLYAVIGTLDGMAAQLACPHMTEKQLRDMEFYTQSMDLALASGNYEMYYKQQEIFHGIYTNQCGNQILISTLEQLKNKFVAKNYDRIDTPDGKNVMLKTNEEHKRMLALFHEKNADALMEYIRNVHWNPELSYTEATTDDAL